MNTKLSFPKLRATISAEEPQHILDPDPGSHKSVSSHNLLLVLKEIVICRRYKTKVKEIHTTQNCNVNV